MAPRIAQELMNFVNISTTTLNNIFSASGATPPPPPPPSVVSIAQTEPVTALNPSFAPYLPKEDFAHLYRSSSETERLWESTDLNLKSPARPSEDTLRPTTLDVHNYEASGKEAIPIPYWDPNPWHSSTSPATDDESIILHPPTPRPKETTAGSCICPDCTKHSEAAVTISYDDAGITSSALKAAELRDAELRCLEEEKALQAAVASQIAGCSISQEEKERQPPQTPASVHPKAVTETRSSPNALKKSRPSPSRVRGRGTRKVEVHNPPQVINTSEGSGQAARNGQNTKSSTSPVEKRCTSKSKLQHPKNRDKNTHSGGTNKKKKSKPRQTTYADLLCCAPM